MSVELIAITKPIIPQFYGEKDELSGQPLIGEREMTADEFIAYAARVSNPANQNNTASASKLIGYLIDNEHWSPFEMVHVVQRIDTTRDIGRQILRHRSFSFQEFSQRYAKATRFNFRPARLQDKKNRQNSIETVDEELHEWWTDTQANIMGMAQKAYEGALDRGIAKEQARAVLPEGLTLSTLYMAGTLRSWIHYCQLRMSHGTQKEHMEIATAAWKNICEAFPSLRAYYAEKNLWGGRENAAAGHTDK